MKQATNKFTKEQRIEIYKKIVKRREDGEKIDDICKEFGIHNTTFYYWRDLFGPGAKTSKATKQVQQMTVNLPSSNSEIMIFVMGKSEDVRFAFEKLAAIKA